MHRAVAVSFVVLLGSCLLAAQTAGLRDTQTIAVRVAPLDSSCPVSLHAQQSSAAARREVGSDETRPKGIAQSLHLSVTNPDARRIVAAQVTVRGFANKGRMLQTMSDQDSSDTAKTFDVPFSVATGSVVSADLRVPGLTAVTAIELNSVTYADGSVWKLAAGSSCRAWIDGLMLVGSH